jgi:Do/DeqQ family serine protease
MPNRPFTSVPRLAGLLLVFAAVFGVGTTGIALAQKREVPPSREVVQYSFAPIARKASPAVVNVYVRRRVQAFSSPFANDPFFRQFFGERFGRPSERVQSSLGSGVIVSPDGTVVTNTHVIKGRGETEIRVALADKREFDARVVMQDDKTDIAILKIEGGDGRFPTIEFEDSDTLEVGDLVLAIGNPFGVGQTVTSGIISALARTEIGKSDSQVFIQTDAAINPGNSGGALIDMSGRLVGINTMIFSQSGGSQGIGFAIPSNLVRLYVQSAATGQKVERPWLGVLLEPVTREIAEALGLDRISGAVVSRVSNRGPGARAGLQAGDVVTRVDGFEVSDPRAVYYRLMTRGIGNSARIDLLRNRQPVTVDLTLASPPQPGKDDVRNLVGSHPFDGARVSNILPGLADELGIDEGDGVAIVSLRPGSIAQRLGFQPGDVITEISRAPIDNIADLEKSLEARQRTWIIGIRRDGKAMLLQVPG